MQGRFSIAPQVAGFASGFASVARCHGTLSVRFHCELDFRRYLLTESDRYRKAQVARSGPRFQDEMLRIAYSVPLNSHDSTVGPTLDLACVFLDKAVLAAVASTHCSYTACGRPSREFAFPFRMAAPSPMTSSAKLSNQPDSLGAACPGDQEEQVAHIRPPCPSILERPIDRPMRIALFPTNASMSTATFSCWHALRSSRNPKEPQHPRTPHVRVLQEAGPASPFWSPPSATRGASAVGPVVGAVRIRTQTNLGEFRSQSLVGTNQCIQSLCRLSLSGDQQVHFYSLSEF